MSRTAIVVGAGIAGSLAVRALSPHFERILWLEKDSELGPNFRAGVPQSRHLHVLLRRGREAMEDLFPGLDSELARAGAPEVDWAGDVAWQGRFGWFPRYDSGVRTRSASRLLLESTLRRMALQTKGVELETGCHVRDFEGGEGRLTAVRTEKGRITGDFFIDASGRTGIASAMVRKVASGIGYASCFLKVPLSAFPGFRQVYIQMRPPERNRGAVLMQVEDGLTLFTLIGSGADRPSANLSAYLEHMASLSDPVIGRLYRAAEWRSEIAVYRRTEGIWRRPRINASNAVPLGDSACAFNPVYGQGMTVAALQAVELRERLKSGAQFGPAAMARKQRLPWFMATSEDLRLPDAKVEGVGRGQRLMMRGFSRLSDRILRQAAGDAATHRAFLRVLHMVDGPLDLLATYARRRLA